MGMCLGVGLYLDKEKQYKVIFEKNSVYHIKGKNNNCLRKFVFFLDANTANIGPAVVDFCLLLHHCLRHRTRGLQPQGLLKKILTGDA